jgi:molybdenum cofactor guanylyltransferase
VDRTAIVISGECSSGFGVDACVLELKGKPLIQHVVDAVSPLVDEVVLVAESQERADVYADILGSHIKYVFDVNASKGSLGCALRGLEAATQKYALLVAGSAPYLSVEVLDLLFDLCPGRSAVVPRYPNAEAETLHAVYRVDAALQAAKDAVADGDLTLDGMLARMRGVRYVSTLVVQELDPDLKTFFRVRGEVDLKRAEVLANPRKKSKNRFQQT